jgi:hypothetical protein
MVVLLLAGDVIEIGAALALAALSPPAAPPQRLPYPTVDLPIVARSPTAAAAAVGVVAGVMMAVALVGELVVLFRRAQIARWRATRRRRAGA